MPTWRDRATKALAGIFPRWGGYGAGSKLTFLLPGATFDYEDEAGQLWRNSIVALAIKWLGDRFPRPPLQVSRIMRGGEYQPLPRHPMVDLWSVPNPHYTRRTLEAAIGLSLVCDGNAYVQIVRNGAGMPVELWWQPHQHVSPIWPDDGSEYISGYELWVDSQRYELPAADVLHFRVGIDPDNVRLGMSATKACLREICTINEEASYTASLLRNSAVPGLAIVPDDPALRPSKDDAERIKERIASAYGGDERGATVVLAGKYKIQPVGFSPEQLKLTELPQAAISRIAASIGVAPMSMGLPDPGKTYSNIQEANKGSWGAVRAVQDVVADVLRHRLLPEFGTDPRGYVVEYDYSNIDELQESLDSLHTRVREDYKYGLMQLNEARDLIGLDPDPDGDRYYPGTGSPDDKPEPAPMLPGVPRMPAPAPEQDAA